MSNFRYNNRKRSEGCLVCGELICKGHFDGDFKCDCGGPFREIGLGHHPACNSILKQYIATKDVYAHILN